ncbi:MAG: response regulator [Candidatus Kapabacteria bacterium]|nr:response regulator [Candidatus Kapabacteria bacterium]
MNILIIEDNDLDFNLIKLKFKYSNLDKIKVERATLLQDALKKLINNQYDVIITDMNLPDSTNNETFEIIYKLYPHIPIIVMTSSLEANLPRRIIGLGAKDFVYKDLNYAEFLSDILKNG